MIAERININCLFCSKKYTKLKSEFDRKTKRGGKIFCSRKCSDDYKSYQSSVELECVECGIKFSKIISCVNKKNNFCSKSCACKHNNKKLRRGENHPNYKNGQNSYTYRKLAIDTYGKKCMICGFDKEYAIEVHHIDRKRTNNKICNLLVLCANCHLGVHRGKIKLKKDYSKLVLSK